MLDYCLSFLEVKKEAFSERCDEASVLSEPCTIVEAEGKYYCSAVAEFMPFLKKETCLFEKNVLERLKVITSLYIKGKNLIPDKNVNIINCFDLTGMGVKTEAELLKGDEEDVLFSDIPYLLSKGPVYGIKENGKIVSLAGAVIKGDVAHIHIETAPAARKKGYAKACLLALCNHLKEDEKRVLYECRRENEASYQTVKSAGGRLICRYIRFIGRK